jgi:DNA-binding beta-propeller fold protein YncE
VSTIPAGSFPRELAVTADGHVLVLTNFASRTVELVDLTRLPVARSPQ